MHLFTPNHLKLLNSCYPPTSALITAGPDYSPNSHELSRLTYYASNHPGKLAKIGGELEKRLKQECRKAKSGNIRSRASLLISLAIFRALATECRRDIALLSPSLIASVDYALHSVSSDLEVVARAASVFTAWTTYTNGHLIGADSYMTNDYLSILAQFSTLSRANSSDQETQNRTRLIGLAALAAALNSEALYNDIAHFGSQVSTILHPILLIIFETDISILDNQSSVVKDTPSSPYLAEFRTRPALERRAASIHVHIDGDKGPSTVDVCDACLHALFSLLSHANGAQLGYIVQSSFENLEAMNFWTQLEHCCWYARKTAEWAQYQYRYVIPTWLVDRLVAHQDFSQFFSVHKALTSMVTSVLSSPTPLINLSSSDIMSNLLTLLLRRISTNPNDEILSYLVDCISSLGCHVYYSDQIQDLAGEIISRLIVIEVQGVTVRDKSLVLKARSLAIQLLLNGLIGLIRAANANDSPDSPDLLEETKKSSNLEKSLKKRVSQDKSRAEATNERPSRRTKVPPDIWQDTLSLLCDLDPLVRRECSASLVYYITQEMPKHGESNDVEISKYRRIAESSYRHHMFPNVGDTASKFFNSVHAYTHILAASPIPTPSSLDSPSWQYSNPSYNIFATTATGNLNNAEGSESLGENNPLSVSSLVLLPSEEDFANITKVLTVIHSHLPIHGLATAVPMLIALNAVFDPINVNHEHFQRIIKLKSIVANVWLSIGQVWKLERLVFLAEQAVKSLSSTPNSEPSSLGINVDESLLLITTCRTVQETFGVGQDGLMRRFSAKWNPELALKDFETSSGFDASLRGDGLSPLLKISPALMHVENISLQSLARSTKGLGVTDLREALEGRSSISNPALVRPPSVSTLDHASSFTGDVSLRLTQTHSRTRNKKVGMQGGARDVRDMLSRLGISKQNTNLLKSTFPTMQKS